MPPRARLPHETLATWWPHLYAALGQMPLLLVALDRDGVIRAAAGMSFLAGGRAPDSLVGRHGRVVAGACPDLWQALCRSLGGETIVSTARVGDCTCQVFCQPIRDHGGRVTGAVAICTDISDRVRAEQALQYQASHDPLTGLPNRTLLHDRLGHALHVAARTNAALAVLMVDLDRFKPINDTLGHAVGDALLKRVAACLTAALRAVDSVSRLGGDEFVVVLPGDRQGGAARVAQHILSMSDDESTQSSLFEEAQSIVNDSDGDICCSPCGRLLSAPDATREPSSAGSPATVCRRRRRIAETWCEPPIPPIAWPACRRAGEMDWQSGVRLISAPHYVRGERGTRFGYRHRHIGLGYSPRRASDSGTRHREDC